MINDAIIVSIIVKMIVHFNTCCNMPKWYLESFSAINFEMEVGNSKLANNTIRKMVGRTVINKPKPCSPSSRAITILIKNSMHSPKKAVTINKNVPL